MKALQHRTHPNLWGYEHRGRFLIAGQEPTIYGDLMTIDQLALRLGFDAVKDFVLVSVKVERV